jgi:hypothetical protein
MDIIQYTPNNGESFSDGGISRVLIAGNDYADFKGAYMSFTTTTVLGGSGGSFKVCGNSLVQISKLLVKTGTGVVLEEIQNANQLYLINSKIKPYDWHRAIGSLFMNGPANTDAGALVLATGKTYGAGGDTRILKCYVALSELSDLFNTDSPFPLWATQGLVIEITWNCATGIGVLDTATFTSNTVSALTYYIPHEKLNEQIHNKNLELFNKGELYFTYQRTTTVVSSVSTGTSHNIILPVYKKKVTAILSAISTAVNAVFTSGTSADITSAQLVSGVYRYPQQAYTSKFGMYNEILKYVGFNRTTLAPPFAPLFDNATSSADFVLVFCTDPEPYNMLVDGIDTASNNAGLNILMTLTLSSALNMYSFVKYNTVLKFENAKGITMLD